jgi:conjugal transfer/type IV secretion protein DotA/TraY
MSAHGAEVHTMKRSYFIFAASLALLASGAALAQSTQPADLSSYLAATPAGDFSMKLWESVLGQFARNPFSQAGGPTTLLGKLFIIFNSAIFAVGSALVGYTVVVAAVATAQQGKALGQGMNPTWYPIRAITGIAGMTPILGGFTLSQGLLMSVAALSIGIANTMWSAAVSEPQLTQLVGAGAITGAPGVRGSQIEPIVEGILRSRVCMLTMKRHEVEMSTPADAGGGGVPLDPALLVSVRPQALDDGLIIEYGSKWDPQACGSVSIRLERIRKADSATGYRVASVDYTGIRNAISVGAAEKLLALETKIALLADDYMAQSDANYRARVMDQFNMDSKPLTLASQVYTKDVQDLISGQLADKSSSITQAAQIHMKELGWIGAGSWFSTFAEANAALADATSGIKLNITEPRPPALPETVGEELARFDGALVRARAMQTALAPGNATDQAIDSVIKDTCADVSGTVMGTATGNCSFGQAIVSRFIGGTMRGSGGGSAASGSLFIGTGSDQVGLVNPIIAFKNAGDYIMTVASALITQSFFGEKIAAGAAYVAGTASKWLGAAGSAVGIPAAPGVAAAGNTLATVGSVAGTIATHAVPLGWTLLVLGAAMSIYIPMLPFLVWMGALITWAASFIEGLIAMPLHSLSFLYSDREEGMGGSSSKGNLFYLNTLVRPPLMVLSFFIASSLVIGLGTLQTHLFLPAMASVQGNSITGLASICGFVALFFVLNVVLINSCFELVQVIPDQVIGYVGAGSVDTQLGKSAEGKINSLFMMATRGGNEGLKASALAGAQKKAGAEKKNERKKS